MPGIASNDNWLASAKQHCNMVKTAVRTTVALVPFSVFDLAGAPGAGTLAIGNTANGLVPTDSTAGYPNITNFAASALGYVGGAWVQNTVASTVYFYDRLFAAGAYAFNASVGLTTQPSYSGRLPPGPDYNNLEIWAEQVTASTGIQTVQVTYTNQSGVTARSTGAISQATAGTVGRCWNLPFQSGDSGIQKIESVVGTIATAGTFNVMVLRPLFAASVETAGVGRNYDYAATGLTQLFDTTALYMMVMAPVGTSSGTPYCDLTVASL